MSDWAEERALQFIQDYNNDPLRKNDVAPLAALLRDTAKASLDRAKEWSDWAVQYKNERDEMYGLLNSSEIRHGQARLMRERDEARAEVAQLRAGAGAGAAPPFYRLWQEAQAEVARLRDSVLLNDSLTGNVWVRTRPVSDCEVRLLHAESRIRELEEVVQKLRGQIGSKTEVIL
jgi:hypothetical protein